MRNFFATLDDVQLPEKLPPVLLLAFNRPDLLQKVLEGLEKQSLMPDTIIAYIDGPRAGEIPERKAKIQECKDLLENFKPVQIQIRARENNWGCTKNTLDAITNILKEYESVIFLEDDVVPGPHYFRTMALLLEAYKPFKNIFSIQSFKNFRYFDKEIDRLGADFYVFNFFSSWGFATWSDRWLNVIGQFDYFKLDSLKTVYKIPTNRTVLKIHSFIFRNFYKKPKLDDWNLRLWLITLFNKYLSICPRFSLTRNIGYAHPEAVLTKYNLPEINRDYLETQLKTLPKTLELIPEMHKPLSKIAALKFFGRLIIKELIISPFIRKVLKNCKPVV